jgi:hypothetical protein
VWRRWNLCQGTVYGRTWIVSTVPGPFSNPEVSARTLPTLPSNAGTTLG